MTPLLVMLGAGVGAVLRFLIAELIDREMPWGTFAVNVAGSLLLGLLSGLAVAGQPMALLGVGFCGGLTTYSAFAMQTHTLARRFGLLRSSAYAGLTIGCALGAAALGYWLAAG